MSITLDDAKSRMSQEAINKLKNLTNTHPTINMENKVGNDVLMQALCRAVENDVIHLSSLDDKLIKLLNSSTNTLSQTKLGDILQRIRKHQPNIVCFISLMKGDMSETLHEWVFEGPSVTFNDIFETVINEFNITPASVRNKMVNTLKPTIVNNVSQLISRYINIETGDEKNNINVSINTITRLVNMEDHLLFAEFKEIQ